MKHPFRATAFAAALAACTITGPAAFAQGLVAGA